MTIQDNKKLVQIFWEQLWNKGDFSSVHAIIAEKFVLSTPQGKKYGSTGLEQWISTIRKAAPDIHFEVADVIAEDNKVVTSWNGYGTNSGSFAGRPPTNKTITLSGMSIFQIENNLIVSEELTENLWELMQQLNSVASSH